jgi:hypothetical protein
MNYWFISATCLLSKVATPTVGSHSPLLDGYRGFLREGVVNRHGRDAEYSSAYSASTPPYTFMACTGTNTVLFTARHYTEAEWQC